MEKMIKPIYAPSKEYTVIQHSLPGETLDEQLDSMTKGRVVISNMALSLYTLDDKHKSSIVKATGVKVVGASAKGVRVPKHITDDNMKLLLFNYAKRVVKQSNGEVHKAYRGILEHYENIKSDTNLSNTPLKEYTDYMEILVSWFGLPEQFHKVQTLKLENDGTYTVTFTEVSDFVTKEELETEVEQLKRELAEEREARFKAEEDKRKAEELVKAKLFATDDPQAVEVAITYTSRYQIGVGADSPEDKVDLHPETAFQIPFFKNAFNELCKSSQDKAVQYLASVLPQGGSLDVEAKYLFQGKRISLQEVVEKVNEAQRPTKSLDSSTK